MMNNPTFSCDKCGSFNYDKDVHKKIAKAETVFEVNEAVAGAACSSCGKIQDR